MNLKFDVPSSSLSCGLIRKPTYKLWKNWYTDLIKARDIFTWSLDKWMQFSLKVSKMENEKKDLKHAFENKVCWCHLSLHRLPSLIIQSPSFSKLLRYKVFQHIFFFSVCYKFLLSKLESWTQMWIIRNKRIHFTNWKSQMIDQWPSYYFCNIKDNPQ